MQEMLGPRQLDVRFTGAWGVVEPAKTLEAALKLQPGTQHVAVVGGIGEYDRYVETIAKQSLRSYESRFNFTYLTDLDMPTLLERLRHLPPHTVIYYTSIMEDAAGNEFIDATQSVPLVVEAANAPVFEVDDVSGALLLAVRDSGVGFDVEEVMNTQHRLGLISMRERVSLVKGTMSIDSKPAGGTEINVRIPVATDAVADPMSAVAGGTPQAVTMGVLIAA
jgi:hypothetical protein